jgi:amino-acid N-acetyltransferase
MQIYAQPPAQLTLALLKECDLPTEDITPEHFENFFGCGARDDPKGVVGVELFGDVGLLRSLAVSESVRGRGCGSRLVAEVEAHARAQGVKTMYLLTSTARPLFESLGYVAADRALAPDAIRNAREFSSICPSSAVFMCKKIAA